MPDNYITLPEVRVTAKKKINFWDRVDRAGKGISNFFTSVSTGTKKFTESIKPTVNVNHQADSSMIKLIGLGVLAFYFLKKK